MGNIFAACCKCINKIKINFNRRSTVMRRIHKFITINGCMQAGECVHNNKPVNLLSPYK